MSNNEEHTYTNYSLLNEDFSRRFIIESENSSSSSSAPPIVEEPPKNVTLKQREINENDLNRPIERKINRESYISGWQPYKNHLRKELEKVQNKIDDLGHKKWKTRTEREYDAVEAEIDRLIEEETNPIKDQLKRLERYRFIRNGVYDYPYSKYIGKRYNRKCQKNEKEPLDLNINKKTPNDDLSRQSNPQVDLNINKKAPKFIQSNPLVDLIRNKKTPIFRQIESNPLDLYINKKTPNSDLFRQKGMGQL